MCVLCSRELISSHPDNLETVLRGVVNNELGQLRSPSNIALLGMMLHAWPDEAAKVHKVLLLEQNYFISDVPTPTAAWGCVPGVPDAEGGLPPCPEGLPEGGGEAGSKRVQLLLVCVGSDAEEGAAGPAAAGASAQGESHRWHSI